MTPDYTKCEKPKRYWLPSKVFLAKQNVTTVYKHYKILETAKGILVVQVSVPCCELIIIIFIYLLNLPSGLKMDHDMLNITIKFII